jgi:hypothetical protein
MLLIIGLSSNSDVFPVEALRQVDAVLAQAGFKKEVRSVVRPRNEFSVTYDGPTIEKNRVHELLRTVAEKNRITLTVEVDESVTFP